MWGQLGAQLLVLDVGAADEPGAPDGEKADKDVSPFGAEGLEGELGRVVEHPVVDPVEEGNVAKTEAPNSVVAAVAARDDVRGRALVELEGLDLVNDRGDYLDGTKKKSGRCGFLFCFWNE